MERYLQSTDCTSSITNSRDSKTDISGQAKVPESYQTFLRKRRIPLLRLAMPQVPKSKSSSWRVTKQQESRLLRDDTRQESTHQCQVSTTGCHPTNSLSKDVHNHSVLSPYSLLTDPPRPNNSLSTHRSFCLKAYRLSQFCEVSTSAWNKSVQSSASQANA